MPSKATGHSAPRQRALPEGRIGRCATCRATFLFSPHDTLKTRRHCSKHVSKHASLHRREKAARCASCAKPAPDPVGDGDPKTGRFFFHSLCLQRVKDTRPGGARR
jgi:hypothetical protein